MLGLKIVGWGFLCFLACDILSIYLASFIGLKARTFSELLFNIYANMFFMKKIMRNKLFFRKILNTGIIRFLRLKLYCTR